MSKVKNINDQPRPLCQCGNWLNHWMNVSQNRVRLCVVKGCTNHELEGSHIQKEDSSDTEIYILPLCKQHYESKEVLEVYDDIPFVSADVKKTCGRNVSTVVKEGEL